MTKKKFSAATPRACFGSAKPEKFKPFKRFKLFNVSFPDLNELNYVERFELR